MTTNEENERLGLTVDEARKIIINKELLPKWFEENCGEYGDYDY